MRLIGFMLLLAAFFGCLAQPEQPETLPDNITENITEPENITEIPEIPENVSEIPENITENETVEELTIEVTDQPPEENITGTVFGDGKYVLILDDVVFYGDDACAAITIAYANGTAIKKDVVCPPGDMSWTSPEDERFRIRVTEAAGGYTGTKWAKIIIFE